MSDSTPRVLRAPKLFWQTRRLDGHDDWPFAFWRELFQNSVDAKARNIGIWISEEDRSGVFDRPSGGGTVVQVAFRDDGVGMDENTIRNVFLEPGRSTKTNEQGAIGGFGTARTLLCFSQDRYEIHTRGLVVEGDGSEYILSSAEDALRRAKDHGLSRFARNIETFMGLPGCTFVIDIDPSETEYSWKNVSQYTLRTKLHDFLMMSELRLDNVMLDGERLDLGVRKGRLRTRLSAPGFQDFASVHVTKGEDALHGGRVIVRVNGLAMFDMRSDIDEQVIIELDPKRSRHLLTDNRDRLKNGPSDALWEFVRELLTNKREALRDKSGDREMTLGGEMGSVAAEPRPIEIVVEAEGGGKMNSGALKSRSINNAGGSPADQAGGLPAGQPGRSPDAGLGDGVVVRPDGPGAEPRIPGLHDFHLHLENIKGNAALENAARRWHPKYWRKEGQPLAGRGRESHELLAAWTVACEHALGYVASLRPRVLDNRDHVPFVPGFIISGRTSEGRVGGLHKILPDGRHALLVNPILSDGRIAYDLRRLRDGDGKFGLQRLVHVAIHEACHVIGRSHNDEFADLLTTVSASVDYAAMSASMLERINAVRALYGAKEARIQAIDELAALSAETSPTPDAKESVITVRARRIRPGKRGAAIAYPMATGVLGALAAPENHGTTPAANALMAAAVSQDAIHVDILAGVDEALATAARQDWVPPSGGTAGLDDAQASSISASGGEVLTGGAVADPSRTAEKSGPAVEPSDVVDLGSVDLGSFNLGDVQGGGSSSLLAELGLASNLAVPTESINSQPPRSSEPPQSERQEFPPMLSLNDILGDDSRDDGFRM